MDPAQESEVAVSRNSRIPPARSPTLPDPLASALRRLTRRARCLIVLRGGCASLAAGAGAFLIVMLIDLQFAVLSPWSRWSMTAAACAVSAGALGWYLIRPLARSFTLTGIARLIEQQHPELQERLSSAVELLGSADNPALRGSDDLIGALAGEAAREAAGLRPEREISFRTAFPAAAAAAIVLAILGAMAWGAPRQTRLLFTRAAAPFLNLPNAGGTGLTVQPGDALVAAGSSLTISLRTADAPVPPVRLRRQDGEGRETIADMLAATGGSNPADRVWVATVSNVLDGFRYRIQAGEALSRAFTVRVAAPPALGHVLIRCVNPEYARRSAIQEREGAGAIRALGGSEITVSARVSKPAATALLRITAASTTNLIKGLFRDDADGIGYEFSFVLPRQLQGRWSVLLTDETGLGNAPFDYPLQAIPDAPPVVRLANLRQREIRLARDDRLPVAYAAEDDLGLSGVALVFTGPGLSNEVIRPLPLPEGPDTGRKAAQGETVVSLGDPQLAGATRAVFRVRATDTLPAPFKGPQTGASEMVTLILDDRAPSWKEQVLASQDERAQQAIRQVRRKLAAARDLARGLETPLAKPSAPGADTNKRIDALQDELASADAALRKTAIELDRGFFDPLALRLAALAEGQVGKAENTAGQIRLVDSPAERLAIHSNVTAGIEATLEALDTAAREHELARAAVKRAVELERLAERQAILVRTATAPTPETRAAATEWARTQAHLADQLAAVVKTAPGAVERAAVTFSNLALRTAARAAAAAEHQRELEALAQRCAGTLQPLDPAAPQERTRREPAGEFPERQRDVRSAGAAVSAELGRRQRALVADTARLAGDRDGVALPTQPAASLAQALDAARQSAEAWDAGDAPGAQAAAGAAREALEQAIRLLREAPEASRLSDLTEDLVGASVREERIAEHFAALADGGAADIVEQWQYELAQTAQDLTRNAAAIRAGAEQIGAPARAVAMGTQAGRDLGQALQAAGEAARQMRLSLGGDAAVPVATATQQQAAARLRQAQQSAARSFNETAQNLRGMAALMSIPIAARNPGQPASVTESLVRAYASFRVAAESREIPDAATAAAHASRAAQEAATEAEALGARVAPPALRAAPPGGGGREDAEGTWDARSAAGNEAPEEYRALIERYFEEVSSHEGEEP